MIQWYFALLIGMAGGLVSFICCLVVFFIIVNLASNPRMIVWKVLKG